MVIEKDISLKSYNTFGVDVAAKYFVEVSTTKELRELLKSEEYRNEEKILLGSGSNILFTKSFDGMIIKLNAHESTILSEDDEKIIIRADAGIVWDDFVKDVVEKKYWGAENLSLIPGTVGASPIQNIGAYGVEVGSIISRVNVVMIDSLEIVSLKNSECRFGYRESIFKNELAGKSIITSVEFILSKKRAPVLKYEPLKLFFKNKDESDLSINEIRNAVIDIRQSKLPDPNKLGNAGSFFKNPIIGKSKFEELKVLYPSINSYFVDEESVKISAAWMIDMCGLKGYRIGNVGVHERQPLVIVNYGNASGEEIFDFAEIVRKKVYEKFAVNLVKEINIY